MLSKSKTVGTGATSSAQAASATMPASNSSPVVPEAPVTAPAPKSTASVSDTILNNTSENYSQPASNLVPDNSFEETIQQILDMGGGSWNKETVTRALRAAYNNPELAVDYLYSGIPEIADVAAPNVQDGNNISAEAGVIAALPVSVAPNSSPLNMFPEETVSAAMAGGLGSLDFLRNNPQFQALRTMVQSNPQILQPMLQELGKQNPQLLSLIQEHHQEFLQLLNEPVDGSGGDSFDQLEDMPHAMSVTPEEEAAIERLEAMGFDRALVIEAFLACDRNEELAINYLLENAGDYED
ncbi:hypothetical protein Leryth_015827 [Lithospermum erythrorhizon]|nr:hypothetical protein Leryth_015827 [Lithospermum erythrorhizon]